MIPQSSTALNTAWIDNYIDEINANNVCAELQVLATQIAATVNAELAAIRAEIALLEPYLALLDIPSDIASVITWIEKLIAAQIQPGYNAYLHYVEQLAKYIEKIGQLISAITTAAGKIVNCAVAVPAMI